MISVVSLFRESDQDWKSLILCVVDIGFQDVDPATDFRGAGILGLHNLLAYVKTPSGQKCFQTATSKGTDFFFCSAGLFMTMLAVNLIKARKLDKIFYNARNEQEIQKGFQEFYDRLFNRFHEYWMRECTDKSMMSFNTNLKGYQSRIRSNPYV